MKSVERRIENIEKKLNLGKEQVEPHIITILSANSEVEEALPENVKEWLTYKEQSQQCPNTQLIILHAWDEVEARDLQKTGKSK